MPENIIINGEIRKDNWQYLDKDETDLAALPKGDVVVSLAFWSQNKAALADHDGLLGVFLDSSDEPEAIADDLEKFALVAVNFPTFTDGRGYSSARILRERYKYERDIRAVGDVMQDQLFYMHRCGFTSFAIKEGKDINEALSGLNGISYSYQAAADNPVPLFRQR